MRASTSTLFFNRSMLEVISTKALTLLVGEAFKGGDRQTTAALGSDRAAASIGFRQKPALFEFLQHGAHAVHGIRRIGGRPTSSSSKKTTRASV